MKILVCLGNVPDTTTKIKFTTDMSKFDETGVQWVINPWDELALTRALELKEQSNGVIEKITIINVGKADSEPTIRKALAMGADDAIRIDSEPADSYFIAFQIAYALREQQFDIIFCGIESSDYNSSAVGGMLAEFLDIPSVSSVSSIEIVNNLPVLKREIEGGKETIQIPIPFVAVVQKGIAINPRIPAMRGIMMARTKPLQVVQATETETFFELKEFELPPAKAACKMVDSENTDTLVELLHTEAKVI